MPDRQLTYSTAIWPLSSWSGASSSISSISSFIQQVVTHDANTAGAWTTGGGAPGWHERSGRARWSASGSGKAWHRHAGKTGAESGRSYFGCCSPQIHPHNAAKPALLLPVRSQSTPAATSSRSARNSGASVPPEPISHLASLWCGAAHIFSSPRRAIWLSVRAPDFARLER